MLEDGRILRIVTETQMIDTRLGGIACLVAVLITLVSAMPSRAQETTRADSSPVPCPKIWDSGELATWATPLAGLGVPPSFYSEEEYYAAPVDNLRSYPVYHPDHEPAGYRQWLEKRKPEPLVEVGRPRTRVEWVEAGRRVFDELDIFYFRTDDPKAIAWIRDRESIAKDPPKVTKDGVMPFFRWVIEKEGQVKLSMSNCGSCHQRVLADGSLIRGAPSNLLTGGGVPLAAVLAASARFAPETASRPSRGEDLYQQYGVPWLPDDVHARYRKGATDAELEAGEDVAPIVGTFARFNGSPYYINKFQDLIGVKDHRYLDATGTHKNRGPADIARYGILVQYADDGAVGNYRFQSTAERRLRGRPPDEAMFALGTYLYSLEPPPNPNPFDDLAKSGQRVFTETGCAACHTPPLYTNNKLIPVEGFRPSLNDPATRSLDIMKRRVGTDPGLALRTRKGTGYYKVPTLRGVWYRGLFEHSGSVASLEDWFDPRRLRDDYEPSGWKGLGVTKRAVPGHDFPLDLSIEDRRALIAFLKTL